MRVLTHKEIDPASWDACIRSSINKKPYALYEWLNIFSPKWKALVIGDYEAVMPITARWRFLSREVIQPPFTQQLGLFFKHAEQLQNLPDFLQWIKGQYRHGYIQLNDINFSQALGDLDSRKNYKLNYDKIDFSTFSKSHKRNLKKAEKANIRLDAVSLSRFNRGLALYNPVYAKDIRPHQRKLNRLMAYAQKEGIGRPIAAFHNQNCVAAVFMIMLDDTAYYLLPFTTDIGRQLGAMHHLIAHLSEHLPTIRVLDFEGSELPGIEKFILGFNAMLHPYPVINW